ncbi:hypothetical protein JTB14_036501 [Gonioctena quinquepunctata]|nr:hypothetical protein JTB14_036501 [Gonioctena quinquepunctata]
MHGKGDWKSAVRKRARAIKVGEKKTGGGPPENDLEQKLIDLSGVVVIDGFAGVPELGLLMNVSPVNTTLEAYNDKLSIDQTDNVQPGSCNRTNPAVSKKWTGSEHGSLPPKKDLKKPVKKRSTFVPLYEIYILSFSGITTHKRKKIEDSSSGSDDNDNHDNIGVPQSSKGKGNTGQSSNSPAAPVNIAAPDDFSPSTSEQACIVNPKITMNDGWHENDIGCYIGLASQLTVEKKKELLQNSWVPPRNYDFETDARHLRRKFNHAWLDRYAPWLVYSKRLKGALCKHCVLFPPITVRGVLGSFMIRPFTKFKNVHEDCQKHVTTNVHLNAIAAAKAFLENIPVDVQLQSNHQKEIEENRQILSSIIYCIVFCGTHDMPLRGKEADEGVLLDLLNFRIDSGDAQLKTHLEKCRRYGVYTSPQIQNELIGLCGEVIWENIISDVKKNDGLCSLS